MIGLVWVIAILGRDFDELLRTVRADSAPWLAFTVVAGILAMLMSVPILRMLLDTYAGTSIRHAHAARLLFVAQILRHLPGRIWGLIYLVREMSHVVAPSDMIRANLYLMLYSMAFNLLAALSLVLAVTEGAFVAIPFLVVGLLAVMTSLRCDWPGGIARWLLTYMPERFTRWTGGFASHGRLPWPRVAAILALFMAAWGLYISVWWALGKAFAFLGETNIWLLCASYSLAWVIGYLAMITPGGLGVREAGFVLLATPLAPASSLAFLALFIRAWQLLLEFVLFLAFLFVKTNAGVSSRSAKSEPL